jgi:hypothetical protein
MLTSPCLTPRPILSNKNSQSDASALIVFFAGLTKFQHPIAQLIAPGRHHNRGAPVWPTRRQFNAAATRHVGTTLGAMGGWIAEYFVGALNATLVNVAADDAAGNTVEDAGWVGYAAVTIFLRAWHKISLRERNRHRAHQTADGKRRRNDRANHSFLPRSKPWSVYAQFMLVTRPQRDWITLLGRADEVIKYDDFRGAK